MDPAAPGVRSSSTRSPLVWNAGGALVLLCVLSFQLAASLTRNLAFHTERLRQLAPELLLRAGILGTPYLLILGLSGLRRSVVSFTPALARSAGSWGLVLAAIAALHPYGRSQLASQGGLLLAFTGFVVTQLGLIRGAGAAERGARAVMGYAVGLALPVLWWAGAGLLFEAPAMRARLEWAQRRPPAEWLLRSAACVHGWAWRFQEGYPASLAQAAQAGGPCAGMVAAGDTAAGLRLEYLPAPAEADGRVRDLLLLVRSPRTRGDSVREIILWSDETGLLYRAAGVGRSSVVGEAPLALFARVGDCLTRFRDSAGAYPDGLSAIGIEGNQCVRDSRLRPAGGAPSGIVRLGHFLLSYAPLRDPGHGGAFALHLRPGLYGSSAIRSYRLDQTGIIRGTPFPRNARADDPPVPACEVHGGESCLIEPDSAPSDP